MASVAPGDVMVISTPTTPPSTKAAQMETSSSPSWVLITATTPVSVRRLSCSSFVTCVHLSSCSTPPSGVLSKTQRLLYTQPSCSYVAYIPYSKLTRKILPAIPRSFQVHRLPATALVNAVVAGAKLSNTRLHSTMIFERSFREAIGKREFGDELRESGSQQRQYGYHALRGTGPGSLGLSGDMQLGGHCYRSGRGTRSTQKHSLQASG